MRYAKILQDDFNNAKGISITLFTQACPHHCNGCQNPQTWDFNGGKEFNQKVQNKILELIKKPYISSFVLTGGEPLIDRNLFPLSQLINLIKQKKPDIKIWLYTGYTIEELWEREEPYLSYILDNIDILVDGRFEKDKKDVTLAFRGSTNQRLINMKQTTKDNIIIYDT
jgi:anaerobic ribonucleoside-triphosphate reductase activating protein